jgi:glycosyltransferase involved in cell wall biosynthesis
MCTYNSEATVEKAIQSLEEQTCDSWELLILDNGSKDRTWEILEQMMQSDSRIKAVRVEKNVGWAKGASLCLKRAIGQYMTFLAADDFMLGSGSLAAVEKCIEKENPEIVWTGHAIVVLHSDGTYEICGGKIPNYAVYEGENRISNVFNIMNNIYYNSFFNYLNIDFLRKNNVDFYEPYSGDCEGMTEAMCQANKTVTLNQPIYALTYNTSQTRGSTTWRYYTVQWNSICEALVRYGEYDADKLRYIAIRIMNNNIGLLKSICDGSPVRDMELNPIEKTSIERFVYAEKTLQAEEFTEMFYYAGRERYLKQAFDAVKDCYALCKKDGFSESEIHEKVVWLPHLVNALCEWNGEQFIDLEGLDRNRLDELQFALCHENNTGMWGYELLNGLNLQIHEDEIEIWNTINGKYIDVYLRRIYMLLEKAVQIRQRGRMNEVLKIVREAVDLVRDIKDYLTAEDLKQVTEDIKMVSISE